MGTSKEQLKEWFDKGVEGPNSHMIVKFDDFDGECYPVYVRIGENPRDVARKSSDRTMECYSYYVTWERQSKERRANHWEMPGLNSVRAGQVLPTSDHAPETPTRSISDIYRERGVKLARAAELRQQISSEETKLEDLNREYDVVQRSLHESATEIRSMRREV